MRTLFIFAITILIISCVEKQNKFIELKYNPKIKLELIQELSNDSVNIGFVRDIEVLNNEIYVSDIETNQIHVFDLNLNHLRSSDPFGIGPSSFNYPADFTKYNDKIIVTPNFFNYSYINKEFQKQKFLGTPQELHAGNISRPVFMENTAAVGAYSEKLYLNPNKSKIKSVALLNYKGELIKSICSFDNIYDENLGDAFYESGANVLLSNVFNYSFVVLQCPTTKYYCYNEDGELLKTMSYKPKYFEKPPFFTLDSLRKMNSADKFEKWGSKLTFYRTMIYDNKNNLLNICYGKMRTTSMNSRSIADYDYYLIIINDKFEVIYDGKIDGSMVSIENGYIYTLVDDIDKFIIHKYSVKKL